MSSWCFPQPFASLDTFFLCVCMHVYKCSHVCAHACRSQRAISSTITQHSATNTLFVRQCLSLGWSLPSRKAGRLACGLRSMSPFLQLWDCKMHHAKVIFLNMGSGDRIQVLMQAFLSAMPFLLLYLILDKATNLWKGVGVLRRPACSGHV